MLVRELLDRYQREVVPNHAPQTQKDYGWHLERLARDLGHFDITELKPRDVGMFLAGPGGPVCLNRSVAVLSAAFTMAIGRWWLCENNPCTKVLRNPTEPRKRYIKDWEFKAVYDLASPMIQMMMDLALLTGQRQGDLLKLTRENEWAQGIYFDQGKTGKKLIVGLTDELLAVMMRSRLDPTPNRFYVIRNQAGEPYTPQGFRSNWQRLMKIALKAGVLKEGFHFHDIRAKMVSDDKDVEVASKRAGHQNSGITKRVYDRNIRVVPALR